MSENESFNKSLVVTAPFISDRIVQKYGGRTLDSDLVSSQMISDRIAELNAIRRYFNEQKYIDGVLLTINYTRIIPKSNRVTELFSFEKSTYESIVGAKFEKAANGKFFHVITHYISKNELDASISKLTTAKNILDECFDGSIKKETVADNLISKCNFL